MSKLDDYLSNRVSNLSTGQIGRDNKKYLNLLRTVNTYNVNRAGGDALALAGSDIDTTGLSGKARTGVLSKTLGLLNAPKKMLFTGLGIDPNLTGGDIFKIDSDDSLIGKAGKFAGAFAFDVATDPLTYVGGPGVVGRKAVALMAASRGVRTVALEAGLKAATLKTVGKNADNIIDELYRGHSLFKLSDMADKAVKAGGKLTQESIDAVKGLSIRRAELLRSGITEDAVDNIIKRDLAGEELGRIISESILTKGRKPIIDNLTKVFGDEEIARKVFRSLPAEVQGGVMLRTVTGKTIGRIPGTGSGTSMGAVGEYLNLARFNLSQKIGVKAGGSGLSGKYGAAWSEVRTGLKKAMMDPNFDLLKNNLGRTTTSAYNDFRNAHRAMSAARQTGMFQVWHTLGEASAAKRDFADRGMEESYKNGLMTGYYRSPILAPLDEAGQAGYDTANKLTAAMRDWRDKQVAAGIPVSDRGEDWRPLMLKKEGKQNIRETRPRSSGTQNEDVVYDAGMGRKEFIIPKDVADKNGYTGYSILNTDNIALDAVSANRLMDKDIYETDPIIVAELYMEDASQKIAQKKFIDTALSTGVLTADAAYAQTQARYDRLANYINGLRKISGNKGSQIATQLEKAKQIAADELSAETADTILQRSITENAQIRLDANAKYVAAKDIEKTAADSLRESNNLLNSSRPKESTIRQNLDAYAEDARTKRAIEARKESDKASRRFNTADQNLAAANEEVDLTREMVTEFGDEAQPIADEAFAEAESLVDPYIISKEARDTASDELSGIRAIQKNYRNDLSDAQMRELANYESVLKRHSKIIDEYNSAKLAREKSKGVLDRISKDPVVASADIINTNAAAYAKASTELKQGMANGVSAEEIQALKAAKQERQDILKKSIGYNLNKNSPLMAYRKKVIELADRLSEAEYNTLTVMSSESKLQEVLGTMEKAYTSNNTAEITAAAQAVQDTYRQLRGKINISEMTDLNNLEARALRQGPDDSIDLFRETPALTDYGRALVDIDIKQIATDIGTGNVNLPRQLAGLHATSGVRVVLENMYRAETTNAFKTFVDKIAEPLLLVWKTGVTVGRGPGYVASNLIGGVYMSFLGGVSASNLAEGAQILTKFKGAYTAAQREMPKASAPEQLERAAVILKNSLSKQKINGRPADEVLREFLEYGGYGSTQTQDALQLLRTQGSAADRSAEKFGQAVRAKDTADATRAGRFVTKAVDLALDNPYQRVMNDWAQSSEMFLRFGTYIDSIKKFNDPMMALDRVALLHFDYSDLSSAEMSIRRLVPFYTWTRNNVPLQLRAMVLEPGKIKKWMYAQENIKKVMQEDEDSWYSQMMPEYLQNVGGFVSRIDTDDGPVAFGSRMPYDDINRLFKVGVMPIDKREAAGMLGPVTTLPLSMIEGVNTGTGQKFDPAGVEATGYQNLLARIPGLGSTGARGERRIKEGAAFAVTEALPQISFLDRFLSAVPATRKLATTPQQERATSNRLNLLGVPGIAGFSATTLTTSTLTNEAYTRIDKQNAIIDQAAGKMNVSVEWLRDQIRKGYTTPEIASMIRAGQGDLEKYELAKQKSKKALDPRYARMLEGMADNRINLGY